MADNTVDKDAPVDVNSITADALAMVMAEAVAADVIIADREAMQALIHIATPSERM